MPLLFLVGFVFALLSVGYPLVAYILYREWDKFKGTQADDYAHRCLYGAIALLLFALLGRFLIKALLSKRRKGEDEPKMYTTKNRQSISRPDGSTINVVSTGKEDGQAIIFVHGLNANSNNWYYQRRYFEKTHRVIMIDLAGMGKSTRPANKDFSLSKMAADLNAVIGYSGAQHPVLWGHSMGGMTILTLLAKHKALLLQPVKGIILEHTTYTNPLRTMLFHRSMTAIQKPVLEPLCWLMIVLSPVFWLTGWMSYLNGGSHVIARWLMFAGTQTPAQLEFSTLLSTLTPPAVMARCILGMFNYDVTKELPFVDVPALVVAANKDRLTRPFASDYMKDHLPKAQMAMLTPCNHQGLLERHEEVNEVAATFIASLK